MFSSPTDTRRGVRPLVFDVLGPDMETSLLPEGYRLVLHANPQTLNIKYTRSVTRIQTRGGFVEQHWGDGATSLDLEAVTGGFMRLYSGLSNVTSTKYGGGRRETIAYDKYLDLLALFHNNGSVYDSQGNIVFQGYTKLTFDEGVWIGWFTNFSVTEASDKPYMFTLSSTFQVHKEMMSWRSTVSSDTPTSRRAETEGEFGQAYIPGGW